MAELPRAMALRQLFRHAQRTEGIASEQSGIDLPVACQMQHGRIAQVRYHLRFQCAFGQTFVELPKLTALRQQLIQRLTRLHQLINQPIKLVANFHQTPPAGSL